MTTAERRALGRLARRLHRDHEVRVQDGPGCLVVEHAGTRLTVTVTTAQNKDGAGVTMLFGNQESGKTYGTVADLEVVARKVRFDVTDPARRELIEAHEILLRHPPDRAGMTCVPCGERMPCAVVAEQVKVMVGYGHLDGWEALRAEQGGHSCVGWISPYRF